MYNMPTTMCITPAGVERKLYFYKLMRVYVDHKRYKYTPNMINIVLVTIQYTCTYKHNPNK